MYIVKVHYLDNVKEEFQAIEVMKRGHITILKLKDGTEKTILTELIYKIECQ